MQNKLTYGIGNSMLLIKLIEVTKITISHMETWRAFFHIVAKMASRRHSLKHGIKNMTLKIE